MGWSKSTVYFFAVPETVGDIADERARTKIGTLPEHPLDEHTMAKIGTSFPNKHTMLQLTLWIIEVYVDDLIGMAKNPSRALLSHIAKAIIILIHEVLRRPHTSDHTGRDSISIENLFESEGAWCKEKYILGWIFNGLTFCISLPPRNVQKLRN